MPDQGLLLSHDLRALVGPKTLRDVTFRAEKHFLTEQLWVSEENISFSFSCEVIELVTVQDSKFRSLHAVSKALALSPSDGTDIFILTEGLFEELAIVVQVLHHAWPFLTVANVLEEVVPSKGQPCLHCLLERLESHVFSEPTGF